ncbi:hypothetical protein FXO38_05205 [Capsicum annuum]|nr:hypothetical protein FXO38_05205 [Capsicum annuum]
MFNWSREKELGKNRSTDHSAENNASSHKCRAKNDAGAEPAHYKTRGVGGCEEMETDDTPIAEINISPERLQAFSATLGRHKNLQHVEQILVADVESIANNGVTIPYSKAEIEKLFPATFQVYYMEGWSSCGMMGYEIKESLYANQGSRDVLLQTQPTNLTAQPGRPSPVQGKANMVVDTLSRLSMSIVAHLDEEECELAKEAQNGSWPRKLIG